MFYLLIISKFQISTLAKTSFSGTCHHGMTSLYVDGNLKNIFRMKSDWELRNFRKWGGLGLEPVLGQSCVEVIDIGTNVLSLVYIPSMERSLSQQPSTDIDSRIAYQQNQKLINELQKFLTGHLSGFCDFYTIRVMWAIHHKTSSL